MRVEDTHYDAFISYRHTELDMFVAKTLHKELEAFRLPKNMKKKLGEENISKTRIQRVFRDQDELPISSDLKEPIVWALKNTDFLIVICTPRLRESLWCRTEIEQFIEMHGRERVLAVLAEGEPKDSFPEQLCYVEENGQRKAVEPLAADVRGNTARERKKKIRSESLRLLAPIFGCGYDDLRQRHRERRLKRMAAAAAVVAAVFFAFGAVSTIMAMRIKSQAVQIENQKDEIEKQYTNALKTNAKTQAAEALRILDAGDRIKAVETALSVLPGPDAPDLPLMPQVEYAMIRSLGVYETGNNILPKHTLHHDSAVKFMKISPDGRLLLTADQSGKLFVWDAAAGELAEEVEDAARSFLSAETVGFLDENRIYYPGEYGGLTVYDLSRKSVVYQDTEQSYSALSLSGDGSCFAFIGAKKVCVLNVKSYQKECEYDLSETKWLPGASIALNESGNTLAFTWSDDSAFMGPEQTVLSIMNNETEEAAVEFALGDLEIQQLAFWGDDLLAVTQGPYTSQQRAGLHCIDTLSGEVRWNYESNSIRNVVPLGESGQEGDILVNQYGEIIKLSGLTGESLGVSGYGDTVIDIEPDESGTYAGVRLENGEYHYLTFADMRDANMEGDYNFKAAPASLCESVAGKDFMAAYSNNSKDIVVHMEAVGDQREILIESTGYINDLFANSGENTAVLKSTDQLIAYDLEQNKVLWETYAEEPIMAAAYFGEEQGELVIALPHGIMLVNAATGEKKIKWEQEQLDLSAAQFSSDGTRFAVVGSGKIDVYDTETGDLLMQDEQLEELGIPSAVGISEDLSIYAAACPADGAVKVFPVGEEKAALTIPLNAEYVKSIAVCAEAGRLYVSYLDGRVEAYSLENGLPVMEYTDLTIELKEVRCIDGKGVLLAGTEGAYITDQSGELTAFLTGRCAVLPNRGVYLTANNFELFSFPIYDASMLRKEAETLIGKGKREERR